jgi:propanediol utilization protein
MKDLVVGVSARHIHFNQETFLNLFGEEATPHKIKDLRQPGAYSCDETVEISNSHYVFKNVRVLGPFKSVNQIEISSSDTYLLGMNAPVNKSGDFCNAGTLDVTVGSRAIRLHGAVIIPQRHIHVSQDEAERRGWKEDQKVAVRVDDAATSGVRH